MCAILMIVGGSLLSCCCGQQTDLTMKISLACSAFATLFQSVFTVLGIFHVATLSDSRPLLGPWYGAVFIILLVQLAFFIICDVVLVVHMIQVRRAMKAGLGSLDKPPVQGIAVPEI